MVSPHRSLFFSLICCIGIGLMLLSHVGQAGTRSFELCYGSTAVGLIKADFTLAYYTLDSSGAVPVATTALTVAHDSDQPPGCYIWAGFTDDNTKNYRFVSTITATGVERAVKFPQGGAAQALPWLNRLVMPLSTYAFYKDATDPPLVTIIESGLGTDPTGSTCTLEMRRMGAPELRTLAGVCSVGSFTGTVGNYGATLTFQWAAGDLDMDDCTANTCTYYVHWVATWSTGRVQPFQAFPITVSKF